MKHYAVLFILVPFVVALCLMQSCGKIKGPSFTDYASPRVVVQTPASPASGNVSITFQIMDRERDNASVLLEYSVDNGLVWLTATLANTAEVQGLETSHYPGIEHTVEWNSVADAVGCSGNQNVIVKVLPSDAHNPNGTADTTDSFIVNNFAYNQPPTVTILSGPSGVTTDNTPTFTYQGYDNDGTIAGYYVSIDTDPPTIWTTDTSFTSSTLLEGDYTFHVMARDHAGANSSVVSRSFEVVLSKDSLIWAKRAGGMSSDIGYAISMLSDDSIVVCGKFSHTATFGPGEGNETVLSSAGNPDIFIARYNPDGTLHWARRAGGTVIDDGRAISMLSDDSIAVSGSFQNAATFGPGEDNETVLSSAGSSDIFVARYNPDGTLHWARRAGGTDWDVGYAISVISDDSIVVSGLFKGTVTFGSGEGNETVLSSARGSDIFIARYRK
jgi:hypothetical protein